MLTCKSFVVSLFLFFVCLFFKEVVHLVFARRIVYVTVFNSPATLAATFRLRGLMCVLYFRGSKQWYDRQWLGFLTCAQKFMHAIVYGGWFDRYKGVYTENWSLEKKVLPHRGVEAALAACRARRSSNWAASPPHSCVPTVSKRQGLLCWSVHWRVNSFVYSFCVKTFYGVQ